MIDVQRHGAVAVVTFGHPPVNALSNRAGVVQALHHALASTLADPGVRAIVVTAGGAVFSAGADIAEFVDGAEQFDAMRVLTAAIESAAVPVVMAINGLAVGGGLELILAAHYRICAPQARLGLPEVSLGLLPGGGGTQRLPRLVGVPVALQMMLSGSLVDAHKALQLGLVDRIAGADLVQEAVQWAHSLVARGPRRTRELPIGAQPADAIAQARKHLAVSELNRARVAIIDCVEAAFAQSFDAALELERRRFGELLASEASLGLRHVFAGRREVARIPGLAGKPAAAPIRRVAVIGAGLMGTGIAIAILNAGLEVVLVETRAAALQAALAKIRKTLAREVEKGRIDAATAEGRLAGLRASTALAEAAQAELVIEAVYESLEAKRAVFAALDGIVQPGAILASNTSTLDLDSIAACTQRPQSVVGLHFFSPANVMQLVEVVRGAQTAPEVLLQAMAFTKALGKVGVVAGVCDGFIGNRMFEEYLRQAYFLLEEGALPAQIDGALEHWGMAMGPLRVMDLAGQDIGWSIRKRRAVEQPDRPYSKLPDLICEMGRFGQKTGAGFYRYADGRTAQPDAQIDELIMAHSNRQGLVRRCISDEEIVDRCILALVNEGARILDEGIAARSVDIDMIYVFGYGFPAERGGPMFYAQRLGSKRVFERMAHFAGGRNGWAWTIAPRLLAEARGAVDGAPA
jgi:3-hydroxyacyl-CoA dehydrogenase